MAKKHYQIGPAPLNIKYMKESDPRMFTVFEMINSYIEDFRDHAKEFLENGNIIDTKTTYKINQTISILGNRGVGKTSLLLTLVSKGDKNNCPTNIEDDIILETIDPDKFSAEKNALGWIIFSFEKILKSLKPKCLDFCESKNKKYSELEAIYKELKQVYINSRENSRRDMSGFINGNSEYSRIAEKVLFSEMNLSDKLYDFFSKLVAYNKKTEKQPLIFISFDDVDLCPEQSTKIINTILHYLSHPAVVTIVLGNMETFILGIERNIMKINKVYDSDLERSENKKLAHETSLEIFKKCLPPFYRSYIRKMSYKEIMNFIPYGNKDKYKSSINETMSNIYINDKKLIQLYDFFDLENLNLISSLDEKILNYWLKFYEKSDNIFSSILPQIPRDAINFYYMLDEMVCVTNRFQEFIILYDYYYNILEYQKKNLNYLDELFQIDRIQRKISIKNRFNNLIFFFGKHNNDLDNDVDSNRYSYDFVNYFLNEIDNFNLADKQNFMQYMTLNNSEFIRESNIFDKILIIVNEIENRNYLPIDFKMLFENMPDMIDNLYRRTQIMSRYDSKEDVKIAKSIDLIMLTFNLLIQNLLRYFENVYERKSESNAKNNIDSAQRIKDNVNTIKSEIITLKELKQKGDSEERLRQRIIERIEIENEIFLDSVSYNLKFYDQINNEEISEREGIIVQFITDLAIRMGLLDCKDIETVSNKINTTTLKLMEKVGSFKAFDVTIDNNNTNEVKFLNYYIYKTLAENQKKINEEKTIENRINYLNKQLEKIVRESKTVENIVRGKTKQQEVALRKQIENLTKIHKENEKNYIERKDKIKQKKAQIPNGR